MYSRVPAYAGKNGREQNADIEQIYRGTAHFHLCGCFKKGVIKWIRDRDLIIL